MLLGKNYSGYNNSAAVQTLVAPATNTKGLIIRSASVCSVQTGGQALMISNGAVPASYTDAGAIHLIDVYVGNCEQRKDIYVPAGYGVYAASSSASPNNGAYITYDLVT